jgi:hypothetical protein
VPPPPSTATTDRQTTQKREGDQLGYIVKDRQHTKDEGYTVREDREYCVVHIEMLSRCVLSLSKDKDGVSSIRTGSTTARHTYPIHIYNYTTIQSYIHTYTACTYRGDEDGPSDGTGLLSGEEPLAEPGVAARHHTQRCTTTHTERQTGQRIIHDVYR